MEILLIIGAVIFIGLVIFYFKKKRVAYDPDKELADNNMKRMMKMYK